MIETFAIAGYTRISVDEESDRENTSIENQKAIIQDFVAKKFPQSSLTFYEDRDKSGYTFEQRDGYQKMRPLLMRHQYDILIVKDFSRFARRNSRGLVELEDLRDQGVRIISIGDSIDYPTYDDWTAIQFRFLINEMPVTDASKKVKSVISRRQNDGKWICAVPYGYVITNSKTMTFEIEETAAEVVRSIFSLYNDGWGYKKIANHLTALHIPTPRMAEKQRKENKGEENKIQAKAEWSIVTVQGILENDFYIGTLRQGKYTRKKINGADMKKDESDHIVFENNHDAIIDFRTFATAQEGRKKRTTSNYRGVKKHDNVYSGFLVCGDCGSPMFSMSRSDLKPAYTCGSYHRRGLAGCTSHHTRTDILDKLLKEYVRKVKENSADMLEQLNTSIKNETVEVKNNEETVVILQRQTDDAYEELKATKRQRIRDIMKHPEKEEILEQTYDELEAELEDKIAGLKNQIELTANKRNTIIQVNRIARTAMELFDEILCKDKLDKIDLDLIIDQIVVYEDRLEIKLKADIDHLLGCEAEERELVGASVGRPSESDTAQADIEQSSPYPKQRELVAIGASVSYSQSEGELVTIETSVQSPPEEPANFHQGTKNISNCGSDADAIENDLCAASSIEKAHQSTTITQSARNRADKVLRVHVISSGDPLEIYTDNDGEVIFKKYSPIGELGPFAGQYAEVLHKTGGFPVVVCDRDHVISVAGIPKKELLERRVSPALEDIMEHRKTFAHNTSDNKKLQPVEGVDRYALVAAPIIAAGDVCGSILFLSGESTTNASDTEIKLIMTAAAFLGRQMEE